MENVKQLLGSRVRELRKKQKMTQEALAETIGIEPNNICRIENGRNFPTPENLVKLASALRVKVYELFRYDHLANLEDLKNELFEAIERDKHLTSALFKFYQALK